MDLIGIGVWNRLFVLPSTPYVAQTQLYCLESKKNRVSDKIQQTVSKYRLFESLFGAKTMPNIYVRTTSTIYNGHAHLSPNDNLPKCFKNLFLETLNYAANLNFLAKNTLAALIA